MHGRATLYATDSTISNRIFGYGMREKGKDVTKKADTDVFYSREGEPVTACRANYLDYV